MPTRKSLAVVEQPKPAPTEAWGRKYHRFQCDEEGYEGLWIEAWHNYPQEYRRELLTLENEELLDFLKAQRFIRAWNFTDFQGNELPLPSESDDWIAKTAYEVTQWVWTILVEAPTRAWRDKLVKSAMQSVAT